MGLKPADFDMLRRLIGPGDPDHRGPVEDSDYHADLDLLQDNLTNSSDLLFAQEFAAIETAVERTKNILSREKEGRRGNRDPLIYDLDWDEEAHLAQWYAIVAQTAGLPPVLASAI